LVSKDEAESTLVDPADIEAADAQASSFMKRGIRLLQESPGNAEGALQEFDRALALRHRLPSDVPAHKYGLAACWLNRADALMRLERTPQKALALRACNEAVALLSEMPLSDDARFVRRLVVAHQNRGLALCAHEPPALVDAVAAFAEAIAILDRHEARRLPDRGYLQAVVWTNLANTHASDATTDGDALARESARRAVTLVAPMERDDADAAEAGLTARHVVCQTIARRLSASVEQTAGMPEDVHEATDVADDGLSLVRHWERRGVSRFRKLASDLFRFGGRVYARYQPHFFDEFVRDNLDPRQSSPAYVESAEISAAAVEVKFLCRPR